MTNIEKYEKWLEMAEEDLDTALVMLKSNKYTYVSFMCEQAIEKLAKGIYVYTFNKEAPFTHNISIVLKDIEKVKTCTTPPFVPFGILITMKNGDKYKLSILKRKKYFNWLSDQIN